MTYLRCTIGRWKIDLSSDEAREAFRLIDEEGVRLFRIQIYLPSSDGATQIRHHTSSGLALLSVTGITIIDFSRGKPELRFNGVLRS